MQKLKIFTANLIFLSITLTSQVNAAETDLAGYYLGRDNLAVLSSGTYKDLANPNLGKSTLLLQHVNHYHGMGVHSYSGDKAAPTIMDTSANNRIPEISSLEAPLALTLGKDLYADKLVSNRSESIYSNLSFQFVDALSGKATGSVEDVLFNSSSKRWNTLMKDASIGLQLISATPGLSIGDDKSTEVLTVGKTLGGDFLNNRFKPVFWVAKDAPVKTYTAEFRLVDLKDPTKNGGRFYFDFTNAPEPAAVGDNAQYDDKTGALTIQDVYVDGQHYQVQLEKRNETWVLKTAKLMDKQYHKVPYKYDTATNKLTVGKVKAMGKYYQAVLANTGNFVFKLESTAEVGMH